MVEHTETWKINKILEACEKVSTQMTICGNAKTSNYQIKPVLKKLSNLGFVVRVEPKQGKKTEFNYRAILWEITDLGRGFKEIINSWVEA